MYFFLTSLAASCFYSSLVTAATPVPGKLPILGYNTYNDYACTLTESGINATIAALVSKGLHNAGYQYFQLDCGWQGYNRQSNGSITYDTTVFPSGIKTISDYARSLGFRWSMYTDQGIYACDTSSQHRPGSLGYEKQDALMFAAWNTEYVKVDNCWVDANNDAPKTARTDFPTRYGTMWNALRSVNINNMLVCQWGVPYSNSSTNTLQGPTIWAPSVATSYRISDDIATGWTNVLRIYNEAIWPSLNNLAGPGKLFDMDLLEVGNSGMTADEQKTHFAIWATFKSALMISTNIPNMSDATLAILTNTGLLAVNQDLLATPVKLVQRFSNDHDLFLGSLANGDKVVLLVDHSNTQVSRTIAFSDLGIAKANVNNLWTGVTTTGQTSYTQTVPAHGSIALRLSSITAATVTTPSYTYYAASAATLNGATLASCSACATGKKVGYVSSSATFSVTLTAKPAAATVDVVFDYINGDVSFLGGGTNTRTASISVNGGAGVTVLFPLVGYGWTTDVGRGWKVRLSGFKTDGSTNVITVGGVSGAGYAPDFDRIGVPS